MISFRAKKTTCCFNNTVAIINVKGFKTKEIKGSKIYDDNN